MTDIFIHEDLSKLENRINVSLFGALGVRLFHAWFCARLDLPERAVIFPSMNVFGSEGSIRPDLVVKLDDDAPPLAWIEVECGRDEAQLARFRAQLGERVIALWGRAGHGADLGLDEIAAFLDTVDTQGEHPQIRYNLRHLRTLIGEALDGASTRAYKAAPLSAATLDTPLVKALRAALGDALSFDVGTAMKPGEIRAQTYGERGLSLRVHSRIATGRSMSVLSQSAGRDEITFPSRAKLERYLPEKPRAVAQLAALVAEMGGSMDLAEPEQRATVPLAVVEQRASAIAAVVQALATRTPETAA